MRKEPDKIKWKGRRKSENDEGIGKRRIPEGKCWRVSKIAGTEWKQGRERVKTKTARGFWCEQMLPMQELSFTDIYTYTHQKAKKR